MTLCGVTVVAVGVEALGGGGVGVFETTSKSLIDRFAEVLLGFDDVLEDVFEDVDVEEKKSRIVLSSRPLDRTSSEFNSSAVTWSPSRRRTSATSSSVMSLDSAMSDGCLDVC